MLGSGLRLDTVLGSITKSKVKFVDCSIQYRLALEM